MKRALLALTAVVAIGGLVWAAQDMGGKDQEPPQGAKPSKEHEFLKDMEGTWDAEMKFQIPGAAEQTAKGVETVTMVGGFWVVFDIKFADMMGGPWHGHGTLGFDPVKKKYVGTFIHSMTPFMNLGEGTADAGGKSVTMTWTGVGPSGESEKMREVFEKKDKDNAVMTMYGTGPDGKEMKHFTMTYKRKK